MRPLWTEDHLPHVARVPRLVQGLSSLGLSTWPVPIFKDISGHNTWAVALRMISHEPRIRATLGPQFPQEAGQTLVLSV